MFSHMCLIVAGCSLVAALPAPSARAQDFNAPSSPCRTDVTTYNLVRCLDQALQTSDNRLNRLYEQSMSVLPPQDKERLVSVERIWIQYRDAACLAERNLFEGGTAANPAELACRVAETRDRIAALKRAYGWRLDKFGK